MDFEDLDSAITPGGIKEAHSTLEVHFSECVRLLKRPCMVEGRKREGPEQSNSKVQWPELHVFQGNNMANLRKAMLLGLLRIPKGPTSDGRRIYSKDDMLAHS